MRAYPAIKAIMLCHLLFSICLAPDNVKAQSEKLVAEPPPIAQPLVRQGKFAVRLLYSLGLGKSEVETEAERKLGDSGIAPRNGWIADYPVTPDIVGELRNAVTLAAATSMIKLDKDEALKRFDDVTGIFNLSVEPATMKEAVDPPRAAESGFAAPSSLREYYVTTGPPVITYFRPPSEYAHLYCLVPYPFQSSGYRFPGFFIMNQFHQTLFENGRVEFVTNSFHVFRNHRLFRIDPMARFIGKTYAGIGAPRDYRFIKTGIPGSEVKVFNGHQPWFRSDTGSVSRGVGR